MKRCPVSVFASPYRPRKSTAASGRAFGNAVASWSAALWVLVVLSAVYFVGALLQ